MGFNLDNRAALLIASKNDAISRTAKLSRLIGFIFLIVRTANRLDFGSHSFACQLLPTIGAGRQASRAADLRDGRVESRGKLPHFLALSGDEGVVRDKTGDQTILRQLLFRI